MPTLFGYSRDAKLPAPPLQPPPPTPQHPGERIPHQQYLYSNRKYGFPFQDYPNGFSTNHTQKRVNPLESYASRYPIEDYVKHQVVCKRQLAKSLGPRPEPHPFQSQFLDHNAVGNREGEEDSRDTLERRALERVLSPPPRSFIEELKWLIFLFSIFLAALGIAPLFVGVISSILCLVVRRLVGCLGCERSV